MSMDKPRFARKSGPAKTNHTDGGDLPTRPATVPAADDDLDEIKSAVLAKLALDLGKDASVATDRDWFVAAALTIRDRIVHRWLAVDRANHAQGRKRVYYLSLEFLIGRLFADVLCNLGWTELCVRETAETARESSTWPTRVRCSSIGKISAARVRRLRRN